jgi:hypothetical protein
MKIFSYIFGAGLLIACSSGTQHTADGGTIYTGPPPEVIACNVDTDCCVATDPCHSQAFVVHAGDAVQISQTNCNACIVPPVQVWCENSVCRSATFDFTGNQDTPFTQDHCGSMQLPDSVVLHGEDGGIETMAVYGCGE